MSYEKIIADNKEWIDGVWAKLDAKMSKTAVKSRNKLPSTSVGGVHNDCSKTNIQNWTNGFWGGLMWLMYATKWPKSRASHPTRWPAQQRRMLAECF